jgi:hypothetical protein
MDRDRATQKASGVFYTKDPKRPARGSKSQLL